jgi:hypothetical protein
LTISHHDLVIETDFDETQRGRVVDETWDAGWDRAAGAADAVGSTVADAWTDATDSVSNAWDDASNVVSRHQQGRRPGHRRSRHGRLERTVRSCGCTRPTAARRPTT